MSVDGMANGVAKEIEEALQGHYREQHVLMIDHALKTFDFLHERIRECDLAIDWAEDVVRLPMDKVDRILAIMREGGLTAMARLAGRVHGVVVQMTTLALAGRTGLAVTSNATWMAGDSLSLYSTSASARAVCAP